MPAPVIAPGLRHGEQSLLAIAVVATVCGVRSPEAPAPWARQCTPAELERLRCRRNPRTGRFEPPASRRGGGSCSGSTPRRRMRSSVHG